MRKFCRKLVHLFMVTPYTTKYAPENPELYMKSVLQEKCFHVATTYYSETNSPYENSYWKYIQCSRSFGQTGRHTTQMKMMGEEIKKKKVESAEPLLE